MTIQTIETNAIGTIQSTTFDFYVIAKNSPRFKRITIEIEQNSAVETVQSQLKKYIESSRLIQTVMLSEKQCQVSIGPNAPHSEKLRSMTDLTLEGRAVAQVDVMTQTEYESFTAKVLCEVKTVILQQKTKSKTEPKAAQHSYVAIPVNQAAPKSAKTDQVIFSTYVFLSNVQKSFHNAIMDMLECMRASRERVEEQDEEAEKSKDEKHQYAKQQYAEKRITNQLILDGIEHDTVLRRHLRRVLLG